ncbi:MAG: hypothetical protein R3C25_09055 [Hyphomonadaceae bacterium]
MADEDDPIGPEGDAPPQDAPPDALEPKPDTRASGEEAPESETLTDAEATLPEPPAAVAAEPLAEDILQTGAPEEDAPPIQAPAAQETAPLAEEALFDQAPSQPAPEIIQSEATESEAPEPPSLLEMAAEETAQFAPVPDATDQEEADQEDAAAPLLDVQSSAQALSEADSDPSIPERAIAPPPVSSEPPSEARGELPPNYFRAAGDPEEAQEEPPATLLGRLQERVTGTCRDAWAFIEPKWVAFAGATRAFGAGFWRKLRGVKHPRSIREAAVWTGWAAAAGVAVIVGFFFYVTWGMPSTDDLWEARNGQSITFLDRNGHVILREGAKRAARRSCVAAALRGAGFRRY